MTKEEAIKHCEEVANDRAGCCDECAEEHRQLAEWLKDYKCLLEQEPILDKIRAEILQMPTISLNANDIYKADVLAIIDKYKAESEEEMSIEEKIKTAKEDSWLKDSVSEKEFKEIKDNERRMTRKEIIDGLKFTVEMFINPITGEEYKESIDEDEKIAIEACKGAIELLEQTRWIPCSKRLPEEENKRYWICTDCGYQCECRWTNVNHIWTNLTTNWHWNIMDVPQYSKVVAWMPLPEPYKAESEDKE